MTTISAYIVCRNEERVIERCLHSLEGAVDEVVLVHDGFCEDRTLEIADHYGCRTFVREHAGYCEAHEPFAIEQSRGEWVLNMDADEFLSDELRANLRNLAERQDVDGWEFMWRFWNGTRYITRHGPYKLILVRKSALKLLAVSNTYYGVQGQVARSDLQLGHQPTYDNFSWSTIRTKWTGRARVQARTYLTPWEAIPKYGFPEASNWPMWRDWANRFSPILFIPYGLATYAYSLWRERKVFTPTENIRFSAYHGLYAAMVQFYVAKLRYFERGQHA
jgi:glycosyltransferase involved in cell wall biosynthesis